MRFRLDVLRSSFVFQSQVLTIVGLKDLEPWNGTEDDWNMTASSRLGNRCNARNRFSLLELRLLQVLSLCVECKTRDYSSSTQNNDWKLDESHTATLEFDHLAG